MPVLNLVPVLPLGYNSARYSFGEGTMKGHLLVSSTPPHTRTFRHNSISLSSLPLSPLRWHPLTRHRASLSFDAALGLARLHQAGEERYALTMNKDKSVHYEVSSLSKPDHFLSRLGYPVVCALQSNFIRQSTRSLLREMKKEEKEGKRQS